ncbi:MAG: ABC transporter permease [Hungatella sp.]|jgi:peptide/nickel transport system permease protein|nr:ABC transporter permease [Hungatella sp.]
MGAYILKRLLQLIPTMLIPSVMVFMLIFFSPGDPASLMLGPDATMEQIAQLRTQMGYDQPVAVQMARWFSNLLKGDLGESIFLNQPVVQAIGEHLGVTMALTIFAMVIASSIGVTLGVVSAVNRGKPLDQAAMIFSVFGVSIPEFWLALNLILVFSVYHQIFPIGGYVPFFEDPAGCIKTLFLPAVSLGITQAAFIARMVRSSVLEILDAEYVRTAMAKGLLYRKVVMKHVMKNAMVPTVTVVGMTFSVLLGGAIAIEMVFNLPGIGRLLMNAVLRRDYPLIQGIVLFIAAAYIVINLLVDLIYVYIDPRIEY